MHPASGIRVPRPAAIAAAALSSRVEQLTVGLVGFSAAFNLGNSRAAQERWLGAVAAFELK